MIKKIEIINPQKYEIYINQIRKAPYISTKENYKTVVANKVEYPELQSVKSKLNYDEIIKYKQDLLFKKEYSPQKTVTRG